LINNSKVISHGTPFDQIAVLRSKKRMLSYFSIRRYEKQCSKEFILIS
jgi:hypothetical protein